jgi:hypothetical protein
LDDVEHPRGARTMNEWIWNYGLVQYLADQAESKERDLSA